MIITQYTQNQYSIGDKMVDWTKKTHLSQYLTMILSQSSTFSITYFTGCCEYKMEEKTRYTTMSFLKDKLPYPHVMKLALETLPKVDIYILWHNFWKVPGLIKPFHDQNGMHI